ncbi:MAG: phenylalanine--tRNA ligase subunit beta, partial [Planctomycetota bacterium]
MDISLRWMNDYLEPGDVTAEEAERLLTDAGFPIEAVTPLDDGDTLLDVEVTSNRGDCLSHVGVAREVAASPRASKVRALRVPRGGRDGAEPIRAGGPVGERLTLENATPHVCPRFTAQVIRGVKVGASPDWLVQRLESVGQRSINNVVDITNWLTFELGHPSHVFDLAKLAGHKLVVRWAREGETLATLDGERRTLCPKCLVVADAERATSLAGVIGGLDSEVTDATVDVVLEVATWDPRTVRDQARRHKVRTDASHRFERIVDARMLEWAATRAAALLLEVAGGELCEGMLVEGRGDEPPTAITLRPERCRRILGAEVGDEQIASYLSAHEINVDRDGGVLRCQPPAFRPDLTREIDLIEEVARTHGYDAIPIAERLPMVAAHPQEGERAMREIASVLTGLGYFETVTFSFVRPEEAELWRDASLKAIAVDDERRGAEPSLRPSALPSLLRCRKANQDGRVEQPGGVRLFEATAVFAETEQGASKERRTLTLLSDVAGTGVKRS